MCFILLMGIGGMAVDITSGFRAQTMLQATADSAALAGVIDLPDEDQAIQTAVDYAFANMFQEYHGTVLRYSDVEVGQWHAQYHLFDASSTTPNAVRVRARRSVDNENAVPTTMMRIMGWFRWNVTVHAIAERFIPDCLINGLVAEGQVIMSSNNTFGDEMCIHGQQGVRVRQGNDFDSPGVKVTMPPGVDVTAPNGDVSGNPGLAGALGENILHPWMVNHISEILDQVLARDVSVLPDYINPALPVLTRNQNWNFGDATPGRIYHIVCQSNNQLSAIPSNAVISGIAVISECNLNVRAGAQLSDVLLGSRGGGDLGTVVTAGSGGTGDSGTSIGNSGKGGGGNSGKGGGSSGGGDTSGGGGNTIKANMLFSSNVRLGANDDCAAGGGVQVFSTNNVHFSAGIVINGMQVVAAGNIDLGANNITVKGINAQAGGDIKLESMSNFTACPASGIPGLFTVDYHRLVY